MTLPLLDRYVVEHLGTQLILLPSKLVWWPEEQSIFMADSHFGKASTFRRAGIAVPAGTTAAMLATLSAQIKLLDAKNLIVLGDLFHSTTRAENDFEKELKAWRNRHAMLKIYLVKGNHDIGVESYCRNLQIERFASTSVLRGPFELCHDPAHQNSERFALSGHLHPAVSVGRIKLPCFWIRKTQLILPAFGEFTGTKRICLTENEEAIAICDGHLVRVINSD